jgi:hypothetical protein
LQILNLKFTLLCYQTKENSQFEIWNFHLTACSL